MSRKRPSVHSAEQFAVFLDQMQTPLDSKFDSEFSQAVAKLLRNGNGAAAGGARKDRASGEKQASESTPPAVAPNVHIPRGKLPPKPDFDAIESAARGTVAARKNLLTLLGDLVLSWSNNESLLIYVLMVLLETDEPSAAITFATLNTTRARMDLVHRLVMLKVRDPGMRASVDDVLDRFNEISKVRNELMHAMYSVSPGGEITHTHLMRFVEKRGQISFGDQQPMDQKRLDGIAKACADLRRLNRDFWELLPRLQAAVARRTTGGAGGTKAGGASAT
jgi:hypothetical protein